MSSDKQHYRSAVSYQLKATNQHRRTPSDNFIGATPPTRDIMVSHNSISLEFDEQNDLQNLDDDDKLPNINLNSNYKDKTTVQKEMNDQQVYNSVKGPGRKIRD